MYLRLLFIGAIRPKHTMAHRDISKGLRGHSPVDYELVPGSGRRFVRRRIPPTRVPLQASEDPLAARSTFPDLSKSQGKGASQVEAATKEPDLFDTLRRQMGHMALTNSDLPDTGAILGDSVQGRLSSRHTQSTRSSEQSSGFVAPFAQPGMFERPEVQRQPVATDQNGRAEEEVSADPYLHSLMAPPAILTLTREYKGPRITIQRAVSPIDSSIKGRHSPLEPSRHTSRPDYIEDARELRSLLLHWAICQPHTTHTTFLDDILDDSPDATPRAAVRAPESFTLLDAPLSFRHASYLDRRTILTIVAEDLEHMAQQQSGRDSRFAKESSAEERLRMQSGIRAFDYSGLIRRQKIGLEKLRESVEGALLGRF